MSAPQVAAQPSETPGVTAEDDIRVQDTTDSKTAGWYQPKLEALSPTTVEIFTSYVGIESEEETKAHIYEVRDRAWKILPYPCIGVFRFLDFCIHFSPVYQSVIGRHRAGETLLDLGCCFGQDLRKVAFDSGSSENLVGADIEGRFIELGYELFRDEGKFNAKFSAGSVLEEDFLSEWYGKIDMVYLGSFLHLFSEEQQRTVVKKVQKLLTKKPGALVFGRNIGAEKEGEFRNEDFGKNLYLHSNESIRKLWDFEGDWEIESQLSKYELTGHNTGKMSLKVEDTMQMMFTVRRL